MSCGFIAVLHFTVTAGSSTTSKTRDP